jgi:hypothetical protein
MIGSLHFATSGITRARSIARSLQLRSGAGKRLTPEIRLMIGLARGVNGISPSMPDTAVRLSLCAVSLREIRSLSHYGAVHKISAVPAKSASDWRM